VNIYLPDKPYENFYYAFLKDYSGKFRLIFEDYFAKASTDRLIIHCEGGKDRTGMVIKQGIEIQSKNIIENFNEKKGALQKLYLEINKTKEMINDQIKFIFMNTIIWYYISYDLIKKTVITQKFYEQVDGDEIICYKCGTHVPSKKSTKNISGLASIKIFNVNGYFCKECYKHYFRISLGTIILVPIIYYLYLVFTTPILYLMNLSYIPTIHYIIETSFPVFILSIFVIIIYAIYSSIKISKIYDIKN